MGKTTGHGKAAATVSSTLCRHVPRRTLTSRDLGSVTGSPLGAEHRPFLRTEENMARRIRQGRVQLDRPGIAARTEASTKTVDYWHLHSAQTGFPAKADTDRTGRDWWWQHDIDAFRTAHLADRAAQFTRIDRTGDPADLLTAPQAARVLGHATHRSLPDELLEHPDHAEELPSGRLRRRWYRNTVWDYADDRALRHSTGRPAGTGPGPQTPHPYADDPRLAAACALIDQARAAGQPTSGLGAQLARQLGTAERTGQRLIAAALRLTDHA